VPAAREFVREHLGSWPGDHDVVELLTTELVTNAVLHARSGVMLCMTVQPARVRVDVDDASTVMPPQPVEPPTDSVRGRGLFLVATLSDRWGAIASGRGKRLWFEVNA
jgi:anti-sigma regulatory factor (Ser/Thr protein kinase)